MPCEGPLAVQHQSHGGDVGLLLEATCPDRGRVSGASLGKNNVGRGLIWRREGLDVRRNGALHFETG